jgi:hypothetical protein
VPAPQKRTPKPGDADYDWNSGRARADQLLAEAKGTLATTGAFSKDYERDIKNRELDDARSAQLQDSDQPSVLDTPATKLLRFFKNVVRPIPQAAEKAAMVGSFLAPEVSIPSEAVLSLMAGKRLATGEDEGWLSKGLDALQMIPGVHAGSRVLGRMSKAASKAAEAATAGRAAGDAAEARMLARQMDATGYAPGVVEKLTGIPPNGARSISTATPINHTGVDISGLMDEAAGVKSKPFQERVSDTLKRTTSERSAQRAQWDQARMPPKPREYVNPDAPRRAAELADRENDLFDTLRPAIEKKGTPPSLRHMVDPESALVPEMNVVDPHAVPESPALGAGDDAELSGFIDKYLGNGVRGESRASAPDFPDDARIDRVFEEIRNSLYPIDETGMHTYNPSGVRVANIEDLPIMRGSGVERLGRDSTVPDAASAVGVLDSPIDIKSQLEATLAARKPAALRMLEEMDSPANLTRSGTSDYEDVLDRVYPSTERGRGDLKFARSEQEAVQRMRQEHPYSLGDAAEPFADLNVDIDPYRRAPGQDPFKHLQRAAEQPSLAALADIIKRGAYAR